MSFIRTFLRRNRFSPIFLLLSILLVTYILISSFHPRTTLTEKELRHLSFAPLPVLIKAYDNHRLSLLPTLDLAKIIKAPSSFPSGDSTFPINSEEYHSRLRKFTDEYLSNSPQKVKNGIQDSLHALENRLAPRQETFPRQIWTTSKENPPELWSLWGRLLSLPLGQWWTHIGERKDGQMHGNQESEEWEEKKVDDVTMERYMSEWTGVLLGGKGREKGWEGVWGKLEFGVLKADLFRYMALLCHGGIYADSDTVPITHPYLWGYDAKDITPPDLTLLSLLLEHRRPSTSNPASTLSRRELLEIINHSSFNVTPTSVTSSIPSTSMATSTDYNGNNTSRHVKRMPIPSQGHNILSPEINLVISIEWDASQVFSLSRIRQWYWGNMRRAWDQKHGRRLQFAQYAMIAKPYHPIMLDTIATIVELVESGHMAGLGAIDLTGPGPFTDAVFRYLLVQYGITPRDLRNIWKPVRVGDVLILQNEAFNAPDEAFAGLIARAKSLSEVEGDPWVYGTGWESWRSGGKMVLYHGLRGSWKGQGWG
ncbi:hypothetical protein M231_06783 [Tremella mesenterica]|uniref:Alpha-1,6-mannosyltransferase n=1 Tax=Tremella mesenterica TaxID=5217 RepID=A0A4V1M382_TREME|nr:hypothetical protein M231_06783 [Tremella mesenterica]